MVCPEATATAPRVDDVPQSGQEPHRYTRTQRGVQQQSLQLEQVACCTRNTTRQLGSLVRNEDPPRHRPVRPNTELFTLQRSGHTG